jgi:hypothetical protein
MGGIERTAAAALGRVLKVTPRDILETEEIKRFVATKKNSAVASFKQALSEDGGTTMLAITLLVAATGLVLGLRFNVLVLGLLLLATTAGTFTVAIWSGGNLPVVALHLLATLASVQISYLIGCLIAAQFPARSNPLSSRLQTRYLRRLSARAEIR